MVVDMIVEPNQPSNGTVVGKTQYMLSVFGMPPAGTVGHGVGEY
jgi:hypothetical protein